MAPGWGSGRPSGGRRRLDAATPEPREPAGPPADPVDVARQICLHQLEHAPRTRAELAAVLAKRGVPAEAADQVLGRLTEVGMIDDALFAEMWVTSRHRGRGLAGRALSQELRRKGVDEELVRDAVDTLEPEQELATARELVARRLPATRHLEPQARVRRLAGLLARKGYPAGLAFRVVREALAQEGVEADLEAVLLEADD
ncbi:MAG TPA: regulatory protein RecX [Mycobacteriales bacterium]|nr:regulatory protein RecX [Mycobacteriales bacterium]